MVISGSYSWKLHEITLRYWKLTGHGESHLCVYIYMYIPSSIFDVFFSLYQKQEPIKKNSHLSYWWTPSWSFEFMVFFVPVMSGWFVTRLKYEKDRTSYWWAMSRRFITISSNHNGQILVDYEQKAGNGFQKFHLKVVMISDLAWLNIPVGI